jgi:succinate dehydrogenase / fumarate reductase flavoprotein subunit
MELNGNVPSGPIETLWDQHRFHMKLVNPSNRRKYNIIMVGSGLAGGSAAASLGEMGYNVKCFCYQDSPRRAHSIAAQGGINAAKNYRNDGDSIFRLFYDTVKGGDFRAREANVYRLAQVSLNIIDQCVAQGVPFAREYGGTLDNRSFGGAQVSRTFYARGQTGQQLLLGAYQALERQIAAGTVQMFPRHEMLDLVVIGGRARGIVTRDLITGAIESHVADVVVLATGGYGNVFYLSTNAKGCNATAIWRAHKRGRRRKATRGTRTTFRRTSAIISWSASTRPSATWFPATWLRATPRRFATKAAASGRADTACTWICATQSNGSARK